MAAAATNEWQARTQNREGYAYRAPRQPPPQAETQLVHAWLNVLTVKKIPPQACTIWVTRVEPQPTYDFYIRGDAVVGDHPDRSLYEFITHNRRQSDVAERFVGRIRAPAADGSPIEFGGGELYLPPAPPAQTAPPWSPPGAAAPPWNPYGAPPGPPWGAPPPWWSGAPSGGMPPWWGPTAGPLSALLAAAQPPAPPAAVQQDPNSLAMWKAMQDNSTMLLKTVIEMTNRPPAAPAVAAAAAVDPYEQLLRMVTIVEKLKGPPQETPASIQVVKVDDETTFVTDKNGDIDVGASAIANMKGIRSIVSALRAVRPNGASSGPQPPRRAGLPSPNGAAKANGAS